MIFAEQERLARLQLARSSNVGPVSFRQLLNRFGNAQMALDALPDMAARGGAKTIVVAPQEAVLREMDRVASLSAGFLFWGESGYPALLAQMDSAPPVLVAAGRRELFDLPSVAIVGARNASASACRLARQLAHDLAERGICVVSGLARGIDTAAHAGAIERATIAVVAGGIDVFYPPENAQLQVAMARSGLLLSEMSPGVEPRASHFPRRNRIIAGLSLGTLVVEAAPRSGSLITARLAAEAGREVMAIPGSPMDPRSRGCNQLIREGATLVQDADDVEELLTPIGGGHALRAPLLDWEPAPPSAVEDAGDSERTRLHDLLGMNFVSVDELVRQSGMASAMVQLVLLELELAGRLERGAGAKVRLLAM